MSKNVLKIASWNCCLGILNKLDFVKNILDKHNIDILFLQEVEITNNMNLDLLKIKNYNLELSPTFKIKNLELAQT